MRYEFSYYQIDVRSPHELAMALVDFYGKLGYHKWKIASDMSDANDNGNGNGNGNGKNGNGVVQAESRRDGRLVSIFVRPAALLGISAKEVKIVYQEERARQWR